MILDEMILFTLSVAILLYFLVGFVLAIRADSSDMEEIKLGQKLHVGGSEIESSVEQLVDEHELDAVKSAEILSAENSVEVNRKSSIVADDMEEVKLGQKLRVGGLEIDSGVEELAEEQSVYIDEHEFDSVKSAEILSAENSCELSLKSSVVAAAAASYTEEMILGQKLRVGGFEIESGVEKIVEEQTVKVDEHEFDAVQFPEILSAGNSGEVTVKDFSELQEKSASSDMEEMKLGLKLPFGWSEIESRVEQTVIMDQHEFDAVSFPEILSVENYGDVSVKDFPELRETIINEGTREEESSEVVAASSAMDEMKLGQKLYVGGSEIESRVEELAEEQTINITEHERDAVELPEILSADNSGEVTVKDFSELHEKMIKERTIEEESSVVVAASSAMEETKLGQKLHVGGSKVESRVEELVEEQSINIAENEFDAVNFPYILSAENSGEVTLKDFSESHEKMIVDESELVESLDRRGIVNLQSSEGVPPPTVMEEMKSGEKSSVSGLEIDAKLDELFEKNLTEVDKHDFEAENFTAENLLQVFLDDDPKLHDSLLKESTRGESELVAFIEVIEISHDSTKDVVADQSEEIDDDWEDIKRSELEEDFAAAASFVGNDLAKDGKLASVVSDVQMRLYGLHKIATEGQCNEPQPMALKISAPAKWYQSLFYKL